MKRKKKLKEKKRKEKKLYCFYDTEIISILFSSCHFSQKKHFFQRTLHQSNEKFDTKFEMLRYSEITLFRHFFRQKKKKKKGKNKLKITLDEILNAQ